MISVGFWINSTYIIGGFASTLKIKLFNIWDFEIYI